LSCPIFARFCKVIFTSDQPDLGALEHGLNKAIARAATLDELGNRIGCVVDLSTPFSASEKTQRGERPQLTVQSAWRHPVTRASSRTCWLSSGRKYRAARTAGREAPSKAAARELIRVLKSATNVALLRTIDNPNRGSCVARVFAT
jgi:hypothetical protein